MKALPMFEIRVAVVGYVSVGKTTVINALFGAEYGEVSMKRTTAVVNNFRISTPAHVDPEGTNDEESKNEIAGQQSSVEWSMMVDKPSSPNNTLKQTVGDNKTFRNKDFVKAKSFDIVLDEPLHTMRKNTKLVVVDIPGINEAGTSAKYKEYVNDKWDSFDVAIVVLDGRQGANTEEQLDLLKLVQGNTENIKNIPIIILCNKVDDPEDDEQDALLAELRGAIERMFGVSDRKKALGEILTCVKSKESGDSFNESLIPAVIPISAMHAFLYRCGGE